MLRFSTPGANIVELRFGPEDESLYFLSRHPGRSFWTEYVPFVWRIDRGLNRLADEWRLPTTYHATLSADGRSIYHFCGETNEDSFGTPLLRRELVTGRKTWLVEQDGAWVTQLAASPDEHVVSWGNIVCNGAGGLVSSASRTPSDANFAFPHQVEIVAHCLAYSPDSRLLATGAPSSGLSIWDGEQRIRHYAEPASTLNWSANGQLVWGMSHRIVVASPTTDEPARTWRSTSGNLSAIGLSPNGCLLLAGTRQGVCSFHDPRAAREIASFKWGIGSIHSVAFSPDGLTCAAGGEKGQIVVWDVDV